MKLTEAFSRDRSTGIFEASRPPAVLKQLKLARERFYHSVAFAKRCTYAVQTGCMDYHEAFVCRSWGTALVSLRVIKLNNKPKVIQALSDKASTGRYPLLISVQSADARQTVGNKKLHLKDMKRHKAVGSYCALPTKKAERATLRIAKDRVRRNTWRCIKTCAFGARGRHEVTPPFLSHHLCSPLLPNLRESCQ
jgi:hypothetical protein